MNIADLILIQDIARHGSFAAVARQRGVDPSSIGRLVAAIETELGLRLFARTTRRLELTEAGEVYLSRIIPITEQMERARDEAQAIQSEPRGTLRISSSVAFGQHVIVPQLGQFRATYPEVRVEGIFSDSNLDLVTDRIDLAVRLAPSIEGDYVISKLINTRYRVVASTEYLRQAPPLVRPEDLVNHRVILFHLRTYRSSWSFRDSEGRVTQQAVDGDLVLTPAGAIRDAAVAGLGPALLPDWLVADDIENGNLQSCIDRWSVTATTFDTAAWFIYPNRSYLPAKVRAMIDFLRESLAS